MSNIFDDKLERGRKIYRHVYDLKLEEIRKVQRVRSISQNEFFHVNG